MLNLVHPQRYAQQQKRRVYLTALGLLAFMVCFFQFVVQPKPVPQPLPIPQPTAIASTALPEVVMHETQAPCDLAPPLHVQVRAALWHIQPTQVQLLNEAGQLFLLFPGEFMPHSEWQLKAVLENSLTWLHNDSGCLLQQPLIPHK